MPLPTPCVLVVSIRRAGSRLLLPSATLSAQMEREGRAEPAALASPGRRSWLMKAEPDSRMEKGQDVAFSVDIFQSSPQQTTSWEGVRNPEAKKMMKEEMTIGDRVLFYHSNCKLPGIAGLAEVVKEGYPDHTAWDPSHPYFDAKTDKDNPKWFMVDVQLHRKLPHLVPLALLQYIASPSPSHSVPYLTQSHLDAIASMQLLRRGRLSVQRVEPVAYEAVSLLGERGGWQDWPGKWNPKARAKAKSAKTAEVVAGKDVATPAKKRAAKVDNAKPEGPTGHADGDLHRSGQRRSKRIRATE